MLFLDTAIDLSKHFKTNAPELQMDDCSFRCKLIILKLVIQNV